MMRRYAVEIARAAERDLEGITSYLSQRLASPSAALKVIDEFEELVASLEVQPNAHAAVRDELLAIAGYRWAPVSTYMAFFTVDYDVGEVVVERVLHPTQNWKAIV